MKNRFLAGFVAAGLLAVGSLPAHAQVEAIASNLDSSCVSDGAGGAIDLAACFDAVQSALDAALVGDTETRVGIGFLLGQLAERLPAMAQDIVAAIDAAAVPGVDVGFFNAVGPDYQGPLPAVVSPA